MFNNRNTFFIIALVFVFLIIMVFGFFFITGAISGKSLSDGTISLDHNKTLLLNNGWKAFTDDSFTNQVAIEPTTFKTGEYYFRLEIDSKDMRGGNAFLVNPVYSAYEISVNGELLKRVGVPSSTEERLSLNKALIVPYNQKTDRLDIVFHVSNYSHCFGGSLLNWITYGRYSDVETRSHQENLVDLLIIFGMFLISVLHLYNFYFYRKHTYSFFFFIYMVIFIFHAMFSGRVLISWIIPSISGNMVFRMEELLMVFALPLLMNYIKALFPHEIHRVLLRAVLITAVVFGVLFIVLPYKHAQPAFFIYTIIKIACSIYLIWGMSNAVKAGRFGAVPTLITFLIMFLGMMNDFGNLLGLFSSPRMMYTGLLIFSAQQTYRLIADNTADYQKSVETYEKLEALTNQKESFYSKNSIEFDKPIRNIVELGESLLKGSFGPLNSEQIATASLVVSNGVRLSNMINDILDFTKIKNDSLQLELGPVDFFKVTRKVLNSCESLVAIQDLELKSEVDRQTGLLYADERRFEQILYNIVSNSIKHTEKGRVIIGGESNDESMDITVLAEGCNLDEADVIALFDDYDKGLSENIDERDVSDLSLAIARKLILLHGSGMIIEPADGGLKYKFSLNYWTGEQALSEEEELEIDALINLQPVLDEVTSDRNIDILIAAKDVEELQILKSQLSSMNYSVIPVVTGGELLSRVGEHTADLVVMDVKLPDMSGYDVCTEIRRTYSKDELPVILVINKEDISDMMEGLTSGANDFLTRPYLQEEFLTRVNTHLQLSKISNVYSRFVPTEFLNSLGRENIVDVKLGDQVSREMTILFVDIRAFTNLSENMTPEENFKFINSYLSRFSPMITNNGGFVDKYIGDAIMALFPDRPENALAAAKEMIEHVNVYNGHRANCGYRPINIGIGIHTGNMILGIIGDERRMQGTVISDAVNLASRIQDVTKLYKANVVISQETFVKLENPVDYNFRFLGRVKVKGKDKAVALFEIFDAETENRRKLKNDTKTDFEEAIMKFSRKNFRDAQDLLERVAEKDPDDQTARVFLERIDEMRRAEKKAFLTSL